jgi:hypothetical protein
MVAQLTKNILQKKKNLRKKKKIMVGERPAAPAMASLQLTLKHYNFWLKFAVLVLVLICEFEYIKVN